jgi:hypothetical protein
MLLKDPDVRNFGGVLLRKRQCDLFHCSDNERKNPVVGLHGQDFEHEDEHEEKPFRNSL